MRIIIIKLTDFINTINQSLFKTALSFKHILLKVNAFIKKIVILLIKNQTYRKKVFSFKEISNSNKELFKKMKNITKNSIYKN